MTGVFLEHHILGIVSGLTDEVNDPRSKYSTFERRRSVKTLEELVKVARKNTRAARPQVSTLIDLRAANKNAQTVTDMCLPSTSSHPERTSRICIFSMGYNAENPRR
jgi:hypothetical protein